MAAVKRRRARRGADYYEPPAPPPKRRGTPRLAAIQLDGAVLREGPRVTRSGLGLVAAITGLTFCAAIAGAAWIGAPLFDVREAAAQAADNAVAGAGMRLANVEIVGADGARAEEVRALVDAAGRDSLLAVDPNDLKGRIEALDWVARAQVRRLWPATLRISVERRRAFARWQEDGQISVIDDAGERLFEERAAQNMHLPLVVGAGAGPAAAPLLAALEDLPELRGRTDALVRVGDRRWNLRLDSGATVALPEDEPAAALITLENLQTHHQLLDRPIDRVDLRIRGRLAVRVHPVLAGARVPMLEGA